MRSSRFSPTKVFIAAACITPVLTLVGLSLSEGWSYPALLPASFSTYLWKDFFTAGNNISASFFLTLLIALLVAVLATTAGFFTSRYVAYHRHRSGFMLLAYLPFVLSPVILAVCLKFYFIKLGLAATVPGVVLALLIIAYPYSIIFFAGFWTTRLQHFTQAAQTLGCSMWGATRRVVLPLAKPLFFICFFQTFLIAWFEYGLTAVIGFGKVQTLTVRVYAFITEANLYQAALCACLLIAPPVVLLWINKRALLRTTD